MLSEIQMRDAPLKAEHSDTLGNEPAIFEPKQRRSVWFELIALWLGVLLLIRLLVFLYNVVGVHEVVLGLVPLLFIYGPVVLCNQRKADSYAYRLYVPGFSDIRSWSEVFKLALLLNFGVWVWFIPLYWLYYTFGMPFFWGIEAKSFVGTVPKELLLTVLYQIFYVALPEEFFYRGYFQTRLNELYPRKWNIWGAQLGMGSVYANLFFAFGHSVVQFQWWHFATFFPGMLFAWARERSNGVASGAMFHACCNIGIIVLDTAFGLRSPV